MARRAPFSQYHGGGPGVKTHAFSGRARWMCTPLDTCTPLEFGRLAASLCTGANCSSSKRSQSISDLPPFPSPAARPLVNYQAQLCPPRWTRSPALGTHTYTHVAPSLPAAQARRLSHGGSDPGAASPRARAVLVFLFSSRLGYGKTNFPKRFILAFHPEARVEGQEF